MFSENLNFLMDITNSKNSSLAAAANIDASYISRLRRGDRSLPKGQNYLNNIAKYLARRITDDFQKKIVCQTFCIDEIPHSEGEFAALIVKWLTDSDKPSETQVESFIASLASAGVNGQSDCATGNRNACALSPSFYYNNVGKRRAVERFLTAVTNNKKPCTLLLFSDENMSWLTEDTAFAKRWVKLVTAVLKQGNRIKIIHTINRGVDEMMDALSKWIPVYITGIIEPYYYPKLRDGLFQRTLFIAPNTAAVVSDSVLRDASDGLSMYIDNRDAVASLKRTFERYLNVCRPLMKIYAANSADAFFKDCSELFSVPAPTIVYASAPSFMTMPKEVAFSIADRHGCPKFLEMWEFCAERLSENLKNPYTEIVTALPDHCEKISVPLSDMINFGGLYYTRGEYARHIENCIRIAKGNQNYKIMSAPENDAPIKIFAKEYAGVYLSRPVPASTVFMFSEQNMSQSFWEYLKTKAEQCQSNSSEENFVAAFIGRL